MEIKRTNNIHFGDSAVIKSKDVRLMQTARNVSQAPDTGLRFEVLNQQADRDGFYNAFVMNKEEKELFDSWTKLDKKNLEKKHRFTDLDLYSELLSRIEKRAEQFVVSSMDELKNVPILESIKSKLELL